jgi:hypothetical protein
MKFNKEKSCCIVIPVYKPFYALSVQEKAYFNKL